MDNNISFSKIVATPTLNAWSQAYNAGKLFAVLSLEKSQDYPQEAESLNVLGKNLLERLEQEFFVIEDKNLESIKKAISVTFMQEAPSIKVSFVAGVIISNILYLFGIGNAKAFIRRGRDIGLLFDSKDTTSKNVASSSGFLQETDLIILTTEAFSEIITQSDLDANLDDNEPSEITESLAPKIHKAENGKISAIVIKYGKPMTEEVIDEGTETEEPEKTIQETVPEEKPILPFYKFLSSFKSIIRKPAGKIHSSKKIFLALIIIIVAILTVSILFTIRAQNNAKIKALFTEIYPQAQKKYDEGQSLLDLNRNLAYDSFLSAQKMLKENINQFPEKSQEKTQAQDLLKKVDSGLTQSSPVDKSGLDRSKLSIKVENGSGAEGAAGKAANILKTFGYNVASTGNADNYKYKGVTIKVKKNQSNFISLLKQDLSKDYTISATSSDLPDNSPTSAVVIIGK
jgi:hypothetical protein